MVVVLLVRLVFARGRRRRYRCAAGTRRGIQLLGQLRLPCLRVRPSITVLTIEFQRAHGRNLLLSRFALSAALGGPVATARRTLHRLQAHIAQILCHGHRADGNLEVAWTETRLAVRFQHIRQISSLHFKVSHLRFQVDVLRFQRFGFGHQIDGALALLHSAFGGRDLIAFSSPFSAVLVFGR